MKKLILVYIFIVSGLYAYPYKLENAFPNLERINHITNIFGYNNKMFVTQREGKILVFQNNPNISSADTFLNLTGIVPVSNLGEGILGMAFHPDYLNNKYFFVIYNLFHDSVTFLRCSRFTTSSNPDSAIKSSELILYTIEYSKPGHYGGTAMFGNDGYLYVSVGDDSWDNDQDPDRGYKAQQLTNFYGKILRLDVNNTSGGLNYSIPVSNPYYNNTQGYKQEIYAYGLRNTWKFSFDYPTGKLWAGDVGENTWEEIDTIEIGKNYGWNKMEGFQCFSCWFTSDKRQDYLCPEPYICDTTGKGFTRPVFNYNHLEGHSITGGFVYRGNKLPTLQNRYIFADYIVGKVWALNYNVTPAISYLLLDSNRFFSSIGVDENMEFYIADYFGGIINRIVSTSPCGYNADVNGDGTTDLTDCALIDNEVYNFVLGYTNTDVNGDGIVDINDLAICECIY